MSECQMCGEPSNTMFCGIDCNCYWHYIKQGKSGKSFNTLINVLVERGDEGVFLSSAKLEMLHRFNWVDKIKPVTYKLSAHGYRAIEMMFGESIGEAS